MWCTLRYFRHLFWWVADGFDGFFFKKGVIYQCFLDQFTKKYMCNEHLLLWRNIVETDWVRMKRLGVHFSCQIFPLLSSEIFFGQNKVKNSFPKFCSNIQGWLWLHNGIYFLFNWRVICVWHSVSPWKWRGCHYCGFTYICPWAYSVEKHSLAICFGSSQHIDWTRTQFSYFIIWSHVK